MMANKDSKRIYEVQKSLISVQQNINRIYNICSALYQEIQDVKKFVEYKASDSLGDVESTTSNINGQTKQQNIKASIDVLNNLEEYTDTNNNNTNFQGQRGRKLKVINN